MFPCKSLILIASAQPLCQTLTNRRPAPALIPAQVRRRETDIAIQDHLERRPSAQGRLRTPLAQYRCQAHRRADSGADADALYGVPRRGSGDAADRGAHARRGGDSPDVVSGIPFARDFALLPVYRLALRRTQSRAEVARRPVGQGERIETDEQLALAFGLPGGPADGYRPVHETSGGNNDPPTSRHGVNGLQVNAIAFLGVFGIHFIAQRQRDARTGRNRQVALWGDRKTRLGTHQDGPRRFGGGRCLNRRCLSRRRLNRRRLNRRRLNRRRNSRRLPAFAAIHQHALGLQGAAHHLPRDGQRRVVAREPPSVHHGVVARTRDQRIDEQGVAFPFHGAAVGGTARPVSGLLAVQRVTDVSGAVNGGFLLHDGEYWFRRNVQTLNAAAARVQRPLTRKIAIRIGGG